jgi:MoaA/NifB/PqqE/SkfB family radical SAM enzyme
MWGDEAAMPKPAAMMNTEALLRFIDEVAHFRPWLRLFGGEPFLHPDWKVVVDHMERHGLPYGAVSNGMRLGREAERLAQSSFTEIGISLDTDRATNDASRGKGTFETIRKGVRALQAAKRRLGTDTPRVAIYTTVHEGTFRHLTAWAEELRSWDIQVLRLQHLIWFSFDQLSRSQALLRRASINPTFFRHEEHAYCRDEVPGVDGEVVARQIRALREGNYPFRILIHPDLPFDEFGRYYGDAEFERHHRRACTNMEGYAYVDPRGRLAPCLTLDMGNVFEEPFLNVWNGASFRAFRRLIRREGRLPLCHRCPD